MNALTPQAGGMPAVPDYIRQLQVAGRKRMHDQLAENLGAGSVPYISIAGGAFTCKGPAGDRRVGQWDQQAGVYLDCMIIDQLEHRSRIFYADEWNPGQQDYKPPACFSHNGTGPSTQCSEPQAPTCAACPNAVWGSATSATGKGVPACSEYQYLALELPGDPQIWLLRVPPASLKNLKKYNEVFANYDQDIPDVLTRIWFEPGKVGSLLFASPGYPSIEMIQYRNQVWHEKKCDPVLSRSDRARDPAAWIAPANALPTQSGPAQAGPPMSPAAQPQYQQPAAPPPATPPMGVAPGYPGGGPAPGFTYPPGQQPGFASPATTPSMPGAPPQQAPMSGQSVPSAGTASPSEQPVRRTRKQRVVQPAAPQPPQNGQMQMPLPAGPTAAPFMPGQPGSQAAPAGPPPGYAPGQPPGYPAAAPGPGMPGMPGQQAGQSAPNPGGQQFGIAQPTAPDPNVMAALDSVIPR